MDKEVNSPKKGTGTAKNEKNEYAGSPFIQLEDLVYAPLQALAESNMRLHTSVIDAVKHLGTVRQNGQEEIVHLDNVNIAYEHLRPEQEEGYSVENIQVKIPMLSLVPISNLNVSRAEIEFSTEVKATAHEDGEYRLDARICAPEQRETDFLPKVSYKMNIRSLPAMEGLLRMTDLLNAAPVASQLDAVSMSPEGQERSAEYNQIAQERDRLKNQEKRLSALYHKITEAIESQEKLQQLAGQDGEQDAKERSFQFHREKYQGLQQKILEDLMRLKEQLIKVEIRLTEEEIV